MTINETLRHNSFRTAIDGSLIWGIGSLMWGHTATVTTVGKDLYKVDVHHWLYDDNADPVEDRHIIEVLHGGRVLEMLFRELPLWGRYYEP